MASMKSAPSVGPPFHGNAFSRFPMPPHAWRVRSSSNRPDPDRRSVTRDCRAVRSWSSRWRRWATKPSWWRCRWPPDIGGPGPSCSAFSLPRPSTTLWLIGRSWAATRMPAAVVQWVLTLGFIGFGVWTLVPDSSVELARLPAWGPLVTTAVVFFLAEMGDKTQLATVALDARFRAPFTVTVGTTLGMLAADGLAVFAGKYLAAFVPMKLIWWAAAEMF